MRCWWFAWQKCIGTWKSKEGFVADVPEHVGTHSQTRPKRNTLVVSRFTGCCDCPFLLVSLFSVYVHNTQSPERTLLSFMNQWFGWQTLVQKLIIWGGREMQQTILFVMTLDGTKSCHMETTLLSSGSRSGNSNVACCHSGLDLWSESSWNVLNKDNKRRCLKKGKRLLSFLRSVVDFKLFSFQIGGNLGWVSNALSTASVGLVSTVPHNQEDTWESIVSIGKYRGVKHRTGQITERCCYLMWRC